MEYMRINGFLGAAFSRLINKTVEKQIGMKPDLKISELELKTTSALKEDDTVQLSLTVNMTKESFEKLIEAVTE